MSLYKSMFSSTAVVAYIVDFVDLYASVHRTLCGGTTSLRFSRVSSLFVGSLCGSCGSWYLDVLSSLGCYHRLGFTVCTLWTIVIASATRAQPFNITSWSLEHKSALLLGTQQQVNASIPETLVKVMATVTDVIDQGACAWSTTSVTAAMILTSTSGLTASIYHYIPHTNSCKRANKNRRTGNHREISASPHRARVETITHNSQ